MITDHDTVEEARMSETDERVCLALAKALDGNGDAQALYEQACDASLRTFMLDFRRRIGRPLGEAEYLATRIAHAQGYLDGMMLGMGLAEYDHDTQQQRRADGAGE